jgi:protein-S-isoprenylcysteine O-methyltransferase Ste14
MSIAREDPERVRAQKRAALIGLAENGIVLFVSAAMMFLCAGRLDWIAGWVYVGLALVSTFAGALLLPTDLQAERSGLPEGAKAWDIALVLYMARIGPLTTLIVAGLDARFGWSHGLSLGVQVAAFLALIPSSGLTLWAMVVNRFFSGLVRIQTDRGHTVVDRGPYGWVRHPGYAGALAYTIATPLLLGSWWGLMPAAVPCAVIVIRTALEDHTLQRELGGYVNYAQRVRYRLLPGVW